MIYSISGICGKMASGQPLLSVKFCFWYAWIILLLAFYAVAWQQIIKYMPLTVAFANKAVTIVWGLLWGVCFFHESVTVGKVLGAILVMAGIILYAKTDGGA